MPPPAAPPVAAPPVARAPVLQETVQPQCPVVPIAGSTSGSSSGGTADAHYGASAATNRRYRMNNSADNFMELFKMQMLKESEAREADQQAREADRQLLRDGLTAVVTGLAHAFKKRKRLNMDNGADDDSDSS